MDLPGILRAVLRAMLTGLRYAAFFVLLYCRGVVQFLLRGFVVLGALAFISFAVFKGGLPWYAYAYQGASVFLAALASWKYDTLLALLTPDGRRLILDV
ncbi:MULTISPECIES: hypothetical protein [unclassified Caulobacter]|uniref:hypothetical protein n=1 Tax=unclassified Caulobacter TaxID=2648921 RepID=UPI0007830FB8|nr:MULTISPECIES: hypothetical protein [unclassified Caulobacter]OYX34108.1 MAG: hypothetical protein B7Y99_06160 [Caulobacterales bacterium 32-69-10]